MKKYYLCLPLAFVILLAACAPAAPVPTAVPSATAGVNPGVASTPAVITGSAVTAVAITALPRNVTPPTPAPFTTLTPIPTLPGGLGPSELKYRLLAQAPNLFFCDPDFYPVARANEMDLARQRFADLQSNAEEFNAILAHNGISAGSAFTDDQKLLIYREHKKLAAIQFTLSDRGYQYQLQVSSTKGSGELITGTINGQGAISGVLSKPIYPTCPICLAAGTLIDTPSGLVPVQDLEVGTMVWTVDRAGNRVAQPVARVGKTVVPSSHQVVHLSLQDGRELWVSPGHPLPDGRAVGQLRAGDALDGGILRLVEWIRYAGYATYDLLPAGETGFYWANGILLASTLSAMDR